MSAGSKILDGLHDAISHARTAREMREAMSISQEARELGGGPADIPGLWWVPNCPELTTAQLLQVASQRLAVRAELEKM